MPVPWLVVGKLVLANLDTIIGVVKPAFTRKKVEALESDGSAQSANRRATSRRVEQRRSSEKAREPS